VNFISLSTNEEWERLLADSFDAPVVIMKHSSTCGTSSYAYELIKRGFEDGTLTLPVYVLVVQVSRDLSNRIASAMNVRHESPQILVVSKGECVYHSSHFSIGPQPIMKAANDLD